MKILKINPKMIIDFLRQQDFDAKLQEETQQVYVIFKDEAREFPFFIRILNNGDLIQLLTFIPCNFTEKTSPEVARLLHLINKEVDIPGFGMDETSHTVFYRIVLPTLGSEIKEEVLNAYLNTLKLVCKSFSPAIETLAAGAMTFDEVLKKANEQKTEAQLH